MNEASSATRARGAPAKAGAAGADFDVLIVGAGLSGIGAACHLVRKRPKTSFAILEARDSIGGTWDLFRYPGVRSDSDMSTFGYAFRPWDDSRAIADGPSILRYLAETAQEYGVDRRIRFGCQVVGASWRSEDARWTLDVRGRGWGDAAVVVQLSCSVRGLLRIRRRLYARLAGDGAIRRPHRSSAEMAGRFALRRQAGRRDRQRSDRGDARSSDGGDRGACRHAAAIADLCRRPPVRGGDGQTARAMASGAAHPRHRALE